jgi:hypothetical protein
MRLRLCAVLLLFTVPLHAAEADPLATARAAIDSCLSRLDAQVDIGYDRIAARCPDLARALEQSGFAQWLPQGWKEARNNLSAGSLSELRTVVGREIATRATARTPRVERLSEILSTLGDTRAQGTGTWSRFKKWLRNLMERRDRAENEDWFDRVVSRVGVSEAIVEIITYVALGAMVMLAVMVVLNELRAAGLLGRRARGRRSDEEAGELSARVLPTFGEIERAPLVERPRLLLEVIAAKLTGLRRLPPASALTVNELARAAQLHDARDREQLVSLARTSERARYAAGGVPADTLETAFAQGRELLRKVETLRAADGAPANATLRAAPAGSGAGA